MMRSFTAQNRAKARPENVIKSVKVVLPDNISDELKNAIYDILASDEFTKLPIMLSARRSLVDPVFKREGRERNMKNRSVDIGYVRSFNRETEELNIMVFGYYGQEVLEIMNPAIEIVFAELNDTLRNITRFNLISLKPNNYSYDLKDEGDDQSADRHPHRGPKFNNRRENNNRRGDFKRDNKFHGKQTRDNAYANDDNDQAHSDDTTLKHEEKPMVTIGDVFQSQMPQNTEAESAQDVEVAAESPEITE